MNWYIVQAYSGFEKKVVESIKDELKKHKLQENLGEILVPTHQVTEVKKGKRTKKEKKFFPGYVLIKIDLTKEIYHMIRLVFILLIIFIAIYIIYKYFPKIRLLLNKVLKSPFIFIILRNLIRLIMRRF